MDNDASPALISIEIDAAQTMVAEQTWDIFGDSLELTLLMDDSNKNKANLRAKFIVNKLKNGRIVGIIAVVV